MVGMKPYEILVGLLKLHLAAGTRFMWRGMRIVVLDERYVLIGGRWGVFLCAKDSFRGWWGRFVEDRLPER